MPEVISTQPQAEQRTHAPYLALNAGGQRNPALNVAAIITFLAGIAGFALGLVVQAHLVATILGLVALALGMVAQMLSASTGQRVFIVAGIIAGAVGAGLGIAHGGFG